ncbi:MAG TPA: hypothetical protein PL084_10710 [Chitinophagales bacterium]|nr:hypothetical protein [Chitinophagales bacterium]HRP39293.1 hypothetical protein [Chitinophagales bacterium]
MSEVSFERWLKRYDGFFQEPYFQLLKIHHKFPNLKNYIETIASIANFIAESFNRSEGTISLESVEELFKYSNFSKLESVFGYQIIADYLKSTSNPYYTGSLYEIDVNAKMLTRTLEGVFKSEISALSIAFDESPFGLGNTFFWHDLNLRSIPSNSQETITSNPTLVKIKWSGNNNQLYDVLRQLKEDKKLILNSYTDLAVFIKTNFEGFEKTALSTIETELSRGKRPTKAKRIKLDLPDTTE